MKRSELFTGLFPVGTGTARSTCEVCYLCVVDEDGVVAVVVDLVAVDVYCGACGNHELECDAQDG